MYLGIYWEEDAGYFYVTEDEKLTTEKMMALHECDVRKLTYEERLKMFRELGAIEVPARGSCFETQIGTPIDREDDLLEGLWLVFPNTRKIPSASSCFEQKEEVLRSWFEEQKVSEQLIEEAMEIFEEGLKAETWADEKLNEQHVKRVYQFFKQF